MGGLNKRERIRMKEGMIWREDTVKNGMHEDVGGVKVMPEWDVVGEEGAPRMTKFLWTFF